MDLESVQSPRDDYNAAATAYEEAAQGLLRKLDQWKSLDSDYRTLQSNLYDALSSSDDAWNDVLNAEDGSSAQKKHIKTLRTSMEAIKTNLSQHDTSLGDLSTTIGRMTKSSTKLMTAITGCKEQHEKVHGVLKARIKAIERDLREIRGSTARPTPVPRR